MQLIWYFDVISPFAYIQHSLFSRLPPNLTVTYQPVLLAGLLDHWQNVGPAEIPPKRSFTYKHCYWLAHRHQVPFKMPPAHPFNSLKAVRLACGLKCDYFVVQTLFETVWRHGLDLPSAEADDYLQEKLADYLAGRSIQEVVGDPQVKNQLRVNSERAGQAGIFGVPTFKVTKSNGRSENFWGLDSFDMLLDFIQRPELFETQEFLQIERLPVGVQRQNKVR